VLVHYDCVHSSETKVPSIVSVSLCITARNAVDSRSVNDDTGPAITTTYWMIKALTTASILRAPTTCECSAH
jgi:hypothetical protein